MKDILVMRDILTEYTDCSFLNELCCMYPLCSSNRLSVSLYDLVLKRCLCHNSSVSGEGARGKTVYFCSRTLIH
jgi:hypothetical protein